MERISRDEMLMEVAKVVARRGTCTRAQVGVVFARQGRILATGYNGAPRGVPHCIHESFHVSASGHFVVPQWLADRAKKASLTIERGTSYHWDGHTLSRSPGKTSAPGCTVAEHAERNAIAFAAREGIRLGGSRVYCTHAPCLDCARALVGAGVESVLYLTPYRLTAGVELLTRQKIQVVDLSTKV